MEKRMKAIMSVTVDQLEEDVNDFLKREKGKLHDFRILYNPEKPLHPYMCFLIYTPEEKWENVMCE